MATNPKNIPSAVKLTDAQLATIAGGGSVVSGSDTFTADESTLYLTPDTSISYEAQTLTAEQQAQARQNIGAGSASATSVLINGVLQSTINFDSDPQTQISGKQNTIDSSHKLNADLIEDGTTNKVFTATEQSKLSGIASGAEVNVQANWNEADSSSDAYIQNKPTIIEPSNPNLLINGDFSVNQRGQASYTYSSSKIFTVDRWRFSGVAETASNVTLTPKTNGITLTMNTTGTTTTYLINPIEELDKLRGKTVTASISTPDGIKSVTYTIPSSGTGGTTAIILTTGLNLRIYIQSTRLEFTIDINPTFTGSYDIYWTKLEIGSVATPFSPRPYAEELEMCKRYFLYLTSTSSPKPICSTFAYSTTNVGAFIPCKLRVSPTLAFDKIQYRAGSGTQILVTITVDGFTTECVSLSCVTTSAVAGEAGLLRTNAANGYIALDAEIY